MRFLEKSLLKQIDHKLMINTITCSMLESPYTYYYDDVDNGVSKSILLEPTIKHLMKDTSLGRWATHNLVRRGQNIGAEVSLMEKNI